MKNLKIHPPSNFYAETDVKPSLTRASLKMNDTIATVVAQKASTDVIRRMALEGGMKTLLGYGLQLVREGLTTLAEVERMLLTDSGLESERRSRSLSTLTCSCCGGGLQDEWLECPYCLTSR